MRKFFLIIFFCFFSGSAAAEFGRSTTFDDREFCEKDRGVWREFGNSLADNCEAKFDRFAIAAQALTYACDCGKGRCWDNKQCISMLEFKKIYDDRQAQMQKRLDMAKRARREEYRENSNERLPVLAEAVGSAPAAVAGQQNQPTAMNNNFDQFRDKFLPENSALLNTNSSNNSADSFVSNSANNNLVTNNNMPQQTQTIVDRGSEILKQVDQSPISRIFTLSNNNQNAANNVAPVPVVPVPTVAAPVATSAPAQDSNILTLPTAQNQNNSAGPTPFFLQQQENAQKEAANNAANQPTPQVITSIPPVPADSGLPEFPQISLPQ